MGVAKRMYGEQYSHEPNIATPRYWSVHGIEMIEERQLALVGKREQGYAALGVMERHLDGREFFVGDGYSIADTALYAYTHVSHEGGFDLAPFPAVRAWLNRCSSQPNHISINAG